MPKYRSFYEISFGLSKYWPTSYRHDQYSVIFKSYKFRENVFRRIIVLEKCFQTFYRFETMFFRELFVWQKLRIEIVLFEKFAFRHFTSTGKPSLWYNIYISTIGESGVQWATGHSEPALHISRRFVTSK